MTEIRSTPILVVAPQRSGTTVFQKTLERAGLCTAFGEVFHENKEEYRLNFFNYLLQETDALKLYAYPTLANVTELFDRYMSFLAQSTDRPFYLVDVKENSLHHFNTVWRDMFECPTILRLWMHRDWPVIRIKRTNIFAQILSQDVSNALKKWHYPVDEEIPAVKIKIDPAQYMRRIQRFEREGQFIDECLKNAKRIAKLDYEDMFTDDAIAPAVTDKLKQLVGTDLISDTKLVFQKTVREPHKFVENREETIEFFSNTQYSDWMSCLNPA